ncbi:hypothetical protein F5X99DRAFT_404184 [Biscogniauxia marginata]|nr:hypothetical protein F5X99DRAFT_404184 [Biscogniauxia marginata]
MQSSAILVGIFAAFAVAQAPPFPSGFPECGATCINNMVGQSSELGCSSGDASCLCTNPDFAYGIRDCATESCSDSSSQIVQFGVDWCAQNGVIIGGFPSASNTGTVSPSTTVDATGSASSGSQSGATSEILSTTTNSDGSVSTTTLGTTTDEGSASGTVVPITTTELVSTVTNSDGSVSTTTFSTSTVFSTSGTESGSGSTTITTESTFTSDGSTGVTSVTTTAPVSSEEGGSEATSTDGENGSATDSPGVGAQQTAAPAGLVAAAVLSL